MSSVAGQESTIAGAAAPPARTGGSGDVKSIIARIERLPLSSWHAKARIFVGFATFFDGYGQLSLSMALPVLIPLWHIAPRQTGLLISVSSIGMMISALTAGRLAERFGRLPVLTVTTCLFSLASLLCAFASNYDTLLVLRIVQGLGLGGEVPVAAAYIAEISPAGVRGRFFIAYELVFVIGLAGASLAGVVVVPNLGWQSIFVLGALPALVALFYRRVLPESPRWLLLRGRIDDADRVVAGIESAIAGEGKVLPTPAVLAIAPSTRQAGWGELFGAQYLGRTILATILCFFTGTLAHGLNVWLPSLYRTIFDLPLTTSLLYGAFASGAGLAGNIVLALLVDRLGRRKWLLINLFGCGIALAALALIERPSATEVAIFVSLATFFTSANATMVYLYLPELFPTRLRASACGIGAFWSRVGNGVAPLAVGFILWRLDIEAVFISISAVAVLAAVVMGIFAIETRRRVLEEIAP